MPAYTEPWVETDPDGSAVTVSQIDDVVRQVKRAVRERMETLVGVGNWATVDPLTLAGVVHVGNFTTDDLTTTDDVIVGDDLVVTGDVFVNTNKFTVNGVNGNTVVAGTLDAAGDFKINTSKFTVAAASGNVVILGNLDLNTNKFNVTASNGNTAIAGTLAVTGAATFTDNVLVGSAKDLGWTSRSKMISPSDGVIVMSEADGTGFSMLKLGGVSASEVAFKVNGTTIEFKKADDSAFIGIKALDGVFTGNVSVTGTLRSVGAQGYDTGAGGSVNQATNNNTAVTLNKLCGRINLNTTLNAGVACVFLVNNNLVLDTDTIEVNVSGQSSGQPGLYICQANRIVNATSFYVYVKNETVANDTGLFVTFAIKRAVTS